MQREIGAAKFKAECLGLMEEVKAKQIRIVITKNGQPVADLVPHKKRVNKDPLADLFIGGEIHGDISGPVVPWEDYEALR